MRHHGTARGGAAFDVRDGNFLVLAGIFVYLRTFLLPAIPLAVQYDAVYFFEHGKRIVGGQAPYRDFFEFVMPGTDLLYAFLIRALGARAWINSCLVILLGVTLCWLLIRISKHVVTGNSVYLPALLFLLLAFDNARDATHHWYSTLFVLAALPPLFKGRTLSQVFAAGIFCGLALCFTQTQGIAGLLAIAAFLILSRTSVAELWKQLAVLILPCVVLAGGTLLFYMHEAGVHPIVYAFLDYSRLFTATQYSYPMGFGGISNDLTGLLWKLSYVLLYFGVPSVYFACLYRLRSKRAPNAPQSEQVLLLTLVGIALYATLLTGPSYHRLCAVVAPSAVLLIWVCRAGPGNGRLVLNNLWNLCLLFFVLLPVRTQLVPRHVLDLPTGRTAVLGSDQYELFRWLGEHTHPGEAFFGYPPAAFALDLRNPTSLDNILPSPMTTDEQEAAVVRSLAQDPPRFIFVRRKQSVDDPSRLPHYRSFVGANYYSLKSFLSGDIWEKRQPNGSEGTSQDR